MSDLWLRLRRILRILWLRWWNPPPEIAPDNSARLILIDQEHRADLAAFDAELSGCRWQREQEWAEERRTAIAAIQRAQSLVSAPESDEQYMDRWADGIRVYADGYTAPIPRR